MKALPGLLPSLKVARAKARQKGGPIVEVVTPSGRRRKLSLEVRVAAAPSQLSHVLRQLARHRPNAANNYPVLASAFLSPRARALCREEGVGYLDLAGNCLLRFDDFIFEKIVDKNPFPQRGRPPSMFSPVSSRILRALLEEPRRMWQVQELARVAEVSLGHASNVCRRLIGEGYAAATERRIRVTQPGLLLEAWRESYSMSRHLASAFYSFERDPGRLARRVARAARVHRWRYAVTSFSAASLVAPFVRGIATVQWYSGEEATPGQWVETLDLRPVDAGANVVVLTPYDAGVFYRARTVNGVTLVGNIQLYLDLWSDPARGREQAEFLRQRRLGF